MSKPCGCTQKNGVPVTCAFHANAKQIQGNSGKKRSPYAWAWNKKSVGELLREKNKEIKNV